MSAYKTIGAAKFRCLAVSLEEASQRLGVSKSAISKWRSGEAKPGAPMRQAIAREWPEIPEIDWVTPLEARQPATGGEPLTSMMAVGDANLAAARDMHREAEAAMAECLANPDVSVRIRDMAVLTKMRLDLGKITGDTRELTDDKLVKMPAVTRLLERIASCLCDECLTKIKGVSGE